MISLFWVPWSYDEVKEETRDCGVSVEEEGCEVRMEELKLNVGGGGGCDDRQAVVASNDDEGVRVVGAC